MRRAALRARSAASAAAHLVPVPEVESMEQLSELLEEACWRTCTESWRFRHGLQKKTGRAPAA